MQTWKTFGVILLGVSLSCWAQTETAESNPEIALQKQLNQPFTRTLEKVELPKAFEEIQAAAHIKIHVDPTAYDALAYGESTRINAEFRSAPLRAAIEEILTPLSLEQTTVVDTVFITPKPALMYIGRRATFDELLLLQSLRTTQWPKFGATVDFQQEIRTLIGKADLLIRIEDADTPEAGKARYERGIGIVRDLLPASIEQALDAYASATGMIWTVDGESILIISKHKWVERQLQRPVLIKQYNAKAENVIEELSRISRVRFVPEAGLYQAVPRITLDSDVTLQRTLDSLMGSYRIDSKIVDDTIVLSLKNAETPTTAAKGEIIGRITIPMDEKAGEAGSGATFDLFVRDTDLPSEFNELRKKRLSDAMNALKAMVKETPTPVPAPASAPTPSTVPAITQAAENP